MDGNDVKGVCRINKVNVFFGMKDDDYFRRATKRVKMMPDLQ